ncbi:MAG: isochorismatase family protein, partial [Deltaproteobacteria bacterium]|nr:isochorismatase family protein [Deltaproteobacteria bacterium]
GGGVWPPHCIQGSRGAEFHPDLTLSQEIVVISSGTRSDEQGFSGFEGKDSDGHPLLDLLKQNGVDRIYVGGLATDYCVRSTVLDALKLGFRVIVIKDAIRGVDLKAGDSERALEEMVQQGAELKTSPPDQE